MFQIVNDARGEGSVGIEEERRTNGSFLKGVILLLNYFFIDSALEGVFFILTVRLCLQIDKFFFHGLHCLCLQKPLEIVSNLLDKRNKEAWNELQKVIFMMKF